MMVEQPKESLGEHWEKKRANENLVAPSLVGQGTDKNLAKRARALACKNPARIEEGQ
jgi:hypothetical protein